MDVEFVVVVVFIVISNFVVVSRNKYWDIMGFSFYKFIVDMVKVRVRELIFSVIVRSGCSRGWVGGSGEIRG